MTLRTLVGRIYLDSSGGFGEFSRIGGTSLITTVLQMDPNHPLVVFQNMVDQAVAKKTGVTPEIKKHYLDNPSYAKAFARIIQQSGLKQMQPAAAAPTPDDPYNQAGVDAAKAQAKAAGVSMLVNKKKGSATIRF